MESFCGAFVVVSVGGAITVTACLCGFMGGPLILTMAQSGEGEYGHALPQRKSHQQKIFAVETDQSWKSSLVSEHDGMTP